MAVQSVSLCISLPMTRYAEHGNPSLLHIGHTNHRSSWAVLSRTPTGRDESWVWTVACPCPRVRSTIQYTIPTTTTTEVRPKISCNQLSSNRSPKGCTRTVDRTWPNSMHETMQPYPVHTPVHGDICSSRSMHPRGTMATAVVVRRSRVRMRTNSYIAAMLVSHCCRASCPSRDPCSYSRNPIVSRPVVVDLQWHPPSSSWLPLLQLLRHPRTMTMAVPYHRTYVPQRAYTYSRPWLRHPYWQCSYFHQSRCPGTTPHPRDDPISRLRTVPDETGM